MARQCQQEQFGYKPIQQGITQQTNSNTTTFNLRILSQQPPLNDTNSATMPSANPRHVQQSPPDSTSPVSSPSSPAPNDQQIARQANVSDIY